MAASDARRATWSTGTMLIVLLMSGINPNWIQPLTNLQIKSSVLVTNKTKVWSARMWFDAFPDRPTCSLGITNNIGRSDSPSVEASLASFHDKLFGNPLGLTVSGSQRVATSF